VSGQTVDTIRLKIDTLAHLLEAGRPYSSLGVKTRFVSGSKPPENMNMWDQWKKCGYHTEVHYRDPTTNQETSIDTVCCAAILQCIMDHQNDAMGHTLVLATGDGNDNNGVNSFTKCVKSAVANGIRVEVWAWKNSCNQIFKKIAKDNPGLVSVHFLDHHRNIICFNQSTDLQKKSADSLLAKGNLTRVMSDRSRKQLLDRRISQCLGSYVKSDEDCVKEIQDIIDDFCDGTLDVVSAVNEWTDEKERGFGHRLAINGWITAMKVAVDGLTLDLNALREKDKCSALHLAVWERKFLEKQDFDVYNDLKRLGIDAKLVNTYRETAEDILFQKQIKIAKVKPIRMSDFPNSEVGAEAFVRAVNNLKDSGLAALFRDHLPDYKLPMHIFYEKKGIHLGE